MVIEAAVVPIFHVVITMSSEQQTTVHGNVWLKMSKV